MGYNILFIIVFVLTLVLESKKEHKLEDNFLLKIVAILVGIFGGFSDRK